MYVDRCICEGVTFAHIRTVARVTGSDLDMLARAAGFGRGCGLCLPYVRESLRTGADRVAVVPAPGLPHAATRADPTRPPAHPSDQLPA